MTIETTVCGLDEIEAKIKRLSEIIIEAKTLAGELASGFDVELVCNVTPKEFKLKNEYDNVKNLMRSALIT